MTLTRRLILAVALLVAVVMVLIPPAQFVAVVDGARRVQVEYRTLWTMDGRINSYHYAGPDVPRLALQLLALAGVTAAAWVLAKPRG